MLTQVLGSLVTGAVSEERRDTYSYIVHELSFEQVQVERTHQEKQGDSPQLGGRQRLPVFYPARMLWMFRFRNGALWQAGTTSVLHEDQGPLKKDSSRL
jgi:hypothetical protein